MDLKKIAFDRRLEVLDMVYSKKSGHIGGSMSCMDILTSLYYSVMDVQKIKEQQEDRDRFILSKGHCSEALYTVLADCGFYDKAELETYTRFGTKFAEHPTKGIPGIEIATGALGHGLSAGVGMAISLKNRKSKAHVYVLMGDGEQAEGSIWEAAMSASKYELDNLTMIVDRNRLQISGGTEEVMPLDHLEEKYQAFGCHVVTCDGHNYEELIPALKEQGSKQPTVVIANTIKGYGSSIMENKADWHHNIPNAEEYEQIKADLTKKGMEVS